MATLTGQSIASSYEQLLHVDTDGGGNSTTHVSVKDGDNGTTFALTLATDAVMITSTNRLEFGDDGTYINQSGDGILNITSDTEVEINATAVDLNGTLDVSGTLTVGADGSGTDVIFYSGTAGDNFTWDASEEKLTITGTDGQTALDIADGNLVVADDVDIEGDIDVNGTANLDNTDIDGTLNVSGDLTLQSKLLVPASAQGIFGAADGDTGIRWEGTDVLAIDTDGSERVTINADGNVGIGTTDIDAWHANIKALRVSGGTTIGGGDSTWGEHAYFLNNAYYSDDWRYMHTSEFPNMIEMNAANGDIIFKTASATGDADVTFNWTTAMTIDNAGDVTIGAGDLIMASGKGISFAAYDAGGSGTPTEGAGDILSDYEEGSWTPVWTGLTTGTGTYLKIGDLVTVQATITSSGGTSGYLALPFTSYNAVFMGSTYSDTESESWNAYVVNSSTNCAMYRGSSAQKQIGAGQNMHLTITYRTAA